MPTFKSLARSMPQLVAFALAGALSAQSVSHDIVVYGAASGGLIAGLQARAMGKSVVVIEPSGHLGGLTTGGLGQTDIDNKQVIGGLSREFYTRVSRHYGEPVSWKWQARGDFNDKGQSHTKQGEATMWTFEPSVAMGIYADWIAASGLEVVKNQRLNRTSGVKTDQRRADRPCQGP